MTAPAKAPAIPPLFRSALERAGLPLPVPEYAFAKDIGRRWRMDFAWESLPGKWDDYVGYRVALEVQGGLWIPGGGRHQRGAALLKEHEKLNEAAALGWRVLFTTPQRLCHPDTIDLIRRALDA